ncbi:hypothetical protein [Streptomyces coeruleorubidus]
MGKTMTVLLAAWARVVVAGALKAPWGVVPAEDQLGPAMVFKLVESAQSRWRAITALHSATPGQ